VQGTREANAGIMNFRMRMFHDANAPLADGLRRKELLSISNEDFESKHGFIQWAFPTPESSNQVSNAPVLDLETAVWLAEKPEVSTFLEAMTVRFLEFLSVNDHWKQRYNHNHLRISRAIQSLRLLHSWELADWFYNKVKEFAGDSFPLMEEANRYWSYYASPVHDRVAGAFVGLAIGDALGAPVEFADRGTFEPVTSYRSGGRFNLPAGAWTDDTAMALCLAQSLIEKRTLDNGDLLNRFCDWAENGTNTSTGIAVGIGQNTLRVLGDFRRNGYLEALPFGAKNDGNGSLMRLAPVSCFAKDNIEEAVVLAGLQSRATHASRHAEECCQILAELLCHLISGKPLMWAVEQAHNRPRNNEISMMMHRNIVEESADDIQSGGYVINTLHAALWSNLTADSFESAVLRACNLGDDADTTAAVAGQIAGAIYGYSNIPQDLKDGLKDERKLYVTSQFLSQSGR
jgi:ADP-ribosylglycohydrolase